MAALARRAVKSPEFVLGVARLFSAQRPSSVNELDDTLRRFFVYRDEYEEIVRTPEFMLNDLETIGRVEGDCDDISTLVAALALFAGWQVRFVAIRYSPDSSGFQHVFNEVNTGSGWRVVDLTVPVGTPIQALEVMEEYVS